MSWRFLKPEAMNKIIDGHVQEPFEHLVIDFHATETVTSGVHCEEASMPRGM